ncbi:hypothetical protein [Saccharothrix sp. Mg75]|uniref:hypothetical protein n=1 Tax=Saccharothrix sp. Mg75 TaxID=3445357 RepID=UPI003EEEAB8A
MPREIPADDQADIDQAKADRDALAKSSAADKASAALYDLVLKAVERGDAEG